MMSVQSISKRFVKLSKSLTHDEAGGEVVEWALILGLIVVVCFVAMAAFGNTLGQRWNALVDYL